MDCFAVQVVPAGRGRPPPRRPLPGLRPHPGQCRRPHRRGQVRRRQLSARDSQPQAELEAAAGVLGLRRSRWPSGPCRGSMGAGAAWRPPEPAARPSDPKPEAERPDVKHYFVQSNFNFQLLCFGFADQEQEQATWLDGGQDDATSISKLRLSVFLRRKAMTFNCQCDETEPRSFSPGFAHQQLKEIRISLLSMSFAARRMIYSQKLWRA